MSSHRAHRDRPALSPGRPGAATRSARVKLSVAGVLLAAISSIAALASDELSPGHLASRRSRAQPFPPDSRASDD